MQHSPPLVARVTYSSCEDSGLNGGLSVDVCSRQSDFRRTLCIREVGSMIGRGAFGQVFEASAYLSTQDKETTRVAIKKLKGLKYECLLSLPCATKPFQRQERVVRKYFERNYQKKSVCVYIYIYIYIYMCVCVCVCVILFVFCLQGRKVLLYISSRIFFSINLRVFFFVFFVFF